MPKRHTTYDEYDNLLELISRKCFLKISDPDHEVIEGAQDQVKNDQEVRRQDEEKQLRHLKSFVYKS